MTCTNVWDWQELTASGDTRDDYDRHAGDSGYFPCDQCGVWLVPDDMPEYGDNDVVLCPECYINSIFA
jgi:hypothetical protein